MVILLYLAYPYIDETLALKDTRNTSFTSKAIIKKYDSNTTETFITIKDGEFIQINNIPLYARMTSHHNIFFGYSGYTFIKMGNSIFKKRGPCSQDMKLFFINTLATGDTTKNLIEYFQNNGYKKIKNNI